MAESTQPKRGVYHFAAVEKKWQVYWERHEVFKAPNPGDAGFDPSKPKHYVLDMFPYPSGAGLHVGHPIGYCATDIFSRYKRMCGYNVLHPIGYDAFGLPAEQYAIETGVHPAVTTKANIDTMRRQLKMFGFSYDWSRELTTCEPEFYHFTQWIFTRLFHSWYDPRRDAARPVSELVSALESQAAFATHSFDVSFDAGSTSRRVWAELNEADRRKVIGNQRLAYLDTIPVNWCPALGTVLANEEVTSEGRSDRGDHPVYRRPLRQWVLRITRYADRLLGNLDGLDWPEPIKLMQRNWIGRSTGADVDFPIVSGGPGAPVIDDFETWFQSHTDRFEDRPAENVIRIYTTRPDTLFGATYMVLAPEHPLVASITTEEHRAVVDQYVTVARHKSDLDRTTDTKGKTGIFTGAYAVNPVSGERVPIWVADYVLMSYGTGAIMAVPGSDVRDFAFAKAHGLDIVAVVEPTLSWSAQDARLPKGSLRELRASAAGRIGESVRRWKAEGESDRAESIRFAEEYLEAHGDDAGLSPEAIQQLFVAAPHIFDAPFADEGVAVQSPAGGTLLGEKGCDLNGLPTQEARSRIIEWLESAGVGRSAVRYKLRDWIFSRQKYWGEPFPVLHGEDGEILTVDESDLPLTLPEMKDFKPEPVADDAAALPQPPLTRAKEWMTVERDGKRFRRDANTMPQWAGSCWYYLRYLSPRNTKRFCDAEAEKYWMPVDVYVGGAEHAVLHLLYARFWHKVLYDLGFVTSAEPFAKLMNQGMVQAFAYRDASKRRWSEDRVKPDGRGGFVLKENSEPVEQYVAKMSKSLKNVVSPDEIIAEFGADAFRLYEMYMGPIESAKPWNTRDVPGVAKLLQRIWRLVVDEQTGRLSPALDDHPPDDKTNRLLHKTIKRITEDIEQFKFNTAIAQMFEFVNALTPMPRRPRQVIESFVLLIAPFAPHIAEELHQRLGRDETVAYRPWPTHDPALAKDVEIEIPVQVCGKVRSRVVVSADADEKTLESAALADERIQRIIGGKTVRKVIVIKGRLVNIVAT